MADLIQKQLAFLDSPRARGLSEKEILVEFDRIASEHWREQVGSRDRSASAPQHDQRHPKP